MSSTEKEYVLVTEYFYPDTASTGQLLTDLATGLEDRGLDMTVYTGQPNYHSGENERQPRKTRHEGVLVKRIRAPQVRQSSLPRRLFNWTVFILWMSAVLACSVPDREREVIFVSNPPFLSIPLWMVCRIRGWDYTYIVHDLYPDQPRILGYISAGGLIDRVWSTLHARVFRDARNIVALGPVMRERIVQNAKGMVSKDDVTIIHNWADGSFIHPREKSNNWFSQKHDLVEPFSIVYSGNIGEFHDLETLVKAAAEFEEGEVQVLVIGEGDNKRHIENLAANLDVHGGVVKFLPYQPHEALPYSLTAGDVSVVTVMEGFEGVCVSSKLYSALAAGEPILCIAQPDDDEARIVKEHDAGKQVSQGDTAEIVTAIQEWRESPERKESQGANAREAFEKHFSREQAVGNYYRLLKE